MYPFSPKLPSLPGCHMTLNRVPWANTAGPCWLSILITPVFTGHLKLLGWPHFIFQHLVCETPLGSRKKYHCENHRLTNIWKHDSGLFGSSRIASACFRTVFWNVLKRSSPKMGNSPDNSCQLWLRIGVREICTLEIFTKDCCLGPTAQVLMCLI